MWYSLLFQIKSSLSVVLSRKRNKLANKSPPRGLGRYRRITCAISLIGPQRGEGHKEVSADEAADLTQLWFYGVSSCKCVWFSLTSLLYRLLPVIHPFAKPKSVPPTLCHVPVKRIYKVFLCVLNPKYLILKQKKVQTLFLIIFYQISHAHQGNFINNFCHFVQYLEEFFFLFFLFQLGWTGHVKFVCNMSHVFVLILYVIKVWLRQA